MIYLVLLTLLLNSMPLSSMDPDDEVMSFEKFFKPLQIAQQCEDVCMQVRMPVERKVIKRLLDTIQDIDQPVEELRGQTLLDHVACWDKYHDYLLQVLKRNPSLQVQACANASLDAPKNFKALLEAYKARDLDITPVINTLMFPYGINYSNPQRSAPLSLFLRACGQDTYHELVPYMLKHEVHLITIMQYVDEQRRPLNVDRITALHVVAQSTSLRNARVIFDALKTKKLNIMNVQNAKGNTPLHLAIQNDHTHSCLEGDNTWYRDIKEPNYKMVHLFCTHGAKTTIQNNRKETPLLRALHFLEKIPAHEQEIKKRKTMDEPEQSIEDTKLHHASLMAIRVLLMHGTEPEKEWGDYPTLRPIRADYYLLKAKNERLRTLHYDRTSYIHYLPLDLIQELQPLIRAQICDFKDLQ